VEIEVCIRDDQGKPILDANTREIIELLSTLKCANKLQVDNVNFELDSKSVVDNLHNKKSDVSNFGAIINDCKHAFLIFVEFSC